MKTMTAVIGLCVFCTVSSFAQGNLLKVVQRGVVRAGFVQKKSLVSVVNGYLRTPNVTHFSLPTGETMRAVRFSRNITLTKENLFVPKGSLAVVNPAGKITLYAPEEVLPADIQAGLEAAAPKLLDCVLEPVAEPSAKPWTGKLFYDNQIDLAKDIDAYYEGKAEETIFNRVTQQEGKVYRIPSGEIHYQPAGNTGSYLDPNKDLILFYPAKNEGQVLLNGLTSDTWRMCCIPYP
ncbi:MAG: hypothetical protein ACI351_04235 [Candidatus Avelusimicrobium sp.]|uniref:hypothetical protein n=1 Tax=Candidatus Avelusimicrobium sp. TaxID=3048833 RepID=UPI003F0F55C7